MAISNLTIVPTDEPPLRGQLSVVINNLAGVEAVLGLIADYLSDVLEDDETAHPALLMSVEQVMAARAALEKVCGD